MAGLMPYHRLQIKMSKDPAAKRPPLGLGGVQGMAPPRQGAGLSESAKNL